VIILTPAETFQFADEHDGQQQCNAAAWPYLKSNVHGLVMALELN